MMVVLRAGDDPAALVPAVRAAIWSVDPEVPISDIETMRAKIDGTLGQPRLLVTLLSSFACTGIALAAVGIYGIVAYSAARRRREIGIKIALGAGRSRVARELVVEGIAHALAGTAVGIAGAAAARAGLASVLVGVSATDPRTYALVALSTLLIGTAACAVPAWRASRTPPSQAIREP
jgi:ABC-type antimicrobial peptide transport system permease subunit